MPATAKLFVSGNSQALRLPKSLRIDAAEVWITRNDATGEITLQPKPRPDELEAFFQLLESAPLNAEEFVPARDGSTAENPLTEWEAPLPGTGRP